MNTNDIIDGIIRREGGFVDHPADRGGATNYGITQATLADWRGRPVTVDDVQKLSETEAREIYRENYLIRPGFLGIESDHVRTLTVDCSVHHGVKNAVILVQRAVRVFPDGIFGPNSRAAVNRMSAAVVYRRLCAARARFLGEIITRNPSQAVFAAGWMNRLAEFLENAP